MATTAFALVPHSPLLIPEIGRANFSFLAQTTAAYQTIGQSLAATDTNLILLISPHVVAAGASYLINVAPEMLLDFKDYGFIPPRTALAGDAVLADKIKTKLRPNFPLELVSEPNLDSGSAVPLYLLKNFVPAAKIVIVSPPHEDDLNDNLNQVYEFGKELRTILNDSDKRIAVIASGDLSHRLKKKSPGGYSPKGAKFDNKLIEYLSEPPTAAANILKMDRKLIKEIGECGLRPLLLLLGLLDGAPWQSEVLAYQTDFGVGYLSLHCAPADEPGPTAETAEKEA